MTASEKIKSFLSKALKVFLAMILAILAPVFWQTLTGGVALFLITLTLWVASIGYFRSQKVKEILGANWSPKGMVFVFSFALLLNLVGYNEYVGAIDYNQFIIESLEKADRYAQSNDYVKAMQILEDINSWKATNRVKQEYNLKRLEYEEILREQQDPIVDVALQKAQQLFDNKQYQAAYDVLKPVSKLRYASNKYKVYELQSKSRKIFDPDNLNISLNTLLVKLKFLDILNHSKTVNSAGKEVNNYAGAGMLVGIIGPKERIENIVFMGVLPQGASKKNKLQIGQNVVQAAALLVAEVTSEKPEDILKWLTVSAKKTKAKKNYGAVEVAFSLGQLKGDVVFTLNICPR